MSSRSAWSVAGAAMTGSGLPGWVPSRSASHSWNDGWVHADRSPVGSALRTSSAGTSAAATRWAVKSTMASAGPPGDGMTSTKPSGGGWSPCAAASSITASGCSVTSGRLDLQQLVGGGVRIELSCRDLRHQSVETLAVAPLVGAYPQPLVHDRSQLLAQALVAPALEPAVGLEVRTMVEHGTPQVFYAPAVGRDGLDDRREPVPIPPPLQHPLQGAARVGGAGAGGLVCDEHAGRLQQARPVGLHPAAPPGGHAP